MNVPVLTPAINSFGAATAVRATLADWRFILRDRGYRLPTKAKYVVQAPVYNAFRRLAIHLSVKNELPSWANNLLSLERQHKRKAA